MGADIVDDLEALAEKVSGRQMLVATTLRRAAAEIGRLRGEVNPWQHAVDQQRVIAHLGVAADGVSLEEATKQLGELIDWHIDVATDPQVNGGYALVKQAPAPAMPNGVEVARVLADFDQDAAEIVRLREDNLRQANAMYADGMASELMDIEPAEAKGGGEEDAYVIERMGKLLAEIAVIVNGPEPDMTRWSYHDLPEKVRALKTAPAAVPAGEAVAVVFTNDGTSEAQFIADGERLNCPRCGGSGHVDDGPQPADGEAVAEWQVWHEQDGWGATHPDNVAEYRARGVPVRPLYAHPPAPVRAAPQEVGDSHAFKNFHRSLCARFGYTHDENDWRRDLASLEEHIARMAAHPSACELGAVREALEAAARSLRTIAEQAGKTEGLDDMMNVRGYANSRANVAELALQHRGDSRGGEG